MTHAFVYAMIERNGHVRYVGQTAGPAGRAIEHASTFGPHVKLIVLERVQWTERLQAEDKWIKAMAIAGRDLANGTAHVLPHNAREMLIQIIAARGFVWASEMAGVNQSTLKRAIAGRPVLRGTIALVLQHLGLPMGIE